MRRALAAMDSASRTESASRFLASQASRIRRWPSSIGRSSIRAICRRPPSRGRFGPTPVGLERRKGGVAPAPGVERVVDHHELLAGQSHDALDEGIGLERSVGKVLVDIDGGEGDHGDELGEVLLEVDALVLGIAGIGEGDDVAARGEPQEGEAPVGQRHPRARVEFRCERRSLFRKAGHHGLRGDLVELEDEGLDEDHEDGREAERVDPFEARAERALPCALAGAPLA